MSEPIPEAVDALARVGVPRHDSDAIGVPEYLGYPAARKVLAAIDRGEVTGYGRLQPLYRRPEPDVGTTVSDRAGIWWTRHHPRGGTSFWRNVMGHRATWQDILDGGTWVIVGRPPT